MVLRRDNGWEIEGVFIRGESDLERNMVKWSVPCEGTSKLTTIFVFNFQMFSFMKRLKNNDINKEKRENEIQTLFGSFEGGFENDVKAKKLKFIYPGGSVPI